MAWVVADGDCSLVADMAVDGCSTAPVYQLLDCKSELASKMGVFCCQWTVCASVGSFPRVFTLIAKLLTGRIGLFKTELYKSCAASRSESEECGSV
jgi:hypothetical protein